MSDEEEQIEEETMDGAADEEGAGDYDELDEADGMDVKKIVLFVVLPLILLIGVGGGLYMTGMLDSVLGKSAPCVEEVDDQGAVIKECPEEDHSEDHAGKGDHGEKGGHGAAGGSFLEIPTMVVNLNTEDSTPRYLRLTVQLELKNAGDLAQVEAVIPRVIDQFQTYLRELRVKDLRGSAGIYRLQTELLWRVNQASPVEIKDVLFQEILIQ